MQYIEEMLEKKPENILKLGLYDNKIVENNSNLTPSGEIILHNFLFLQFLGY